MTLASPNNRFSGRRFAPPLNRSVRAMKLQLVQYAKLNAWQQESYNFQKVSGVLADYGFTTIRLSDDWQGADFIAQHIDGQQFLKVQLKGRCTLAKKYRGKDLYICFHDVSAASFL
jgi:hypothetical protein